MRSPATFDPRRLLGDPRFAIYAPLIERLCSLSDWPSVAALDALFEDRLRVEPAIALESARPRGRRRKLASPPLESIYEVRVHAMGRVPTRERSWHDLLNVLVWAAFPRSKRALAARAHAIAISRIPEHAPRLPGARTREADALAMIDEGALLLVTDRSRAAELERAHRAGDHAAIRAAIDGEHTRALLFGHALMEHLILEGSPDVRGYGLVLAVASSELDMVDRSLATFIEQSELAPAPWRALPLELA